MAEDRAALAAEAFLYGFPLVFDLEEVERFVRQGMGSLPPGAYNEFSHAEKLAGPDDTFVSINNDTVYSIAQIDVGGGPVLLDVPDAAGRYYVLQFVDAWTNNFAYVGHRATGTAERSFLLVPPGWDGDAPDDVWAKICASSSNCARGCARLRQPPAIAPISSVSSRSACCLPSRRTAIPMRA